MTEPSTEPDPDDGNEPGDEPDEGTPTSLSDMTKAQLVDYAEDHGISGVDGKMKKADILEVIKGAE